MIRAVLICLFSGGVRGGSAGHVRSGQPTNKCGVNLRLHTMYARRFRKLDHAMLDMREINARRVARLRFGSKPSDEVPL